MAKVRQDVLFIAQFQKNGVWLKIGRPVLTLASHIFKKGPHPKFLGRGLLAVLKAHIPAMVLRPLPSFYDE